MIPITTPCSFILEASGEAADALMDLISPSAAFKVHQITVLSHNFDSDIEAVLELDRTINDLLCAVPADVVKITNDFNPLYLPDRHSEVENLIELSEDLDGFKFTKFGGNPFVVKTADAAVGEMTVVNAQIVCEEFEIPSYQDLVRPGQFSSIN